MAQPQTFANLKTLLNILLDDGTQNYYTDDDRDMALNSAYFALFNDAASAGNGMGLSSKEATLTITADDAEVTLPSDLYKIVEVYYKESEQRTLPWFTTTPGNSHEVRQMLSRGNRQLAYYTRGTKLVCVPTPNWSSSTLIKIHYVGNPTAMSDDADEPDAIPLTHRTLIAYTALKILKEKEGAGLGPDAQEIFSRLTAAFERDMEDRTGQRSRRLAGNTVYRTFDTRGY